MELIHSRTGCFTILEHPLTRVFFSCVPHEIICVETFFMGLYIALSADLINCPLLEKTKVNFFDTEVAFAKVYFPCA